MAVRFLHFVSQQTLPRSVATLTSMLLTRTLKRSFLRAALSAMAQSTKATRVHHVKAGSGGFHFEPAELTNVSAGDIVSFEFYPPDHSVARADYGHACVPYEYTGSNRTGFWSETQWVTTPSEVSHLLLTTSLSIALNDTKNRLSNGI
jgi:plastocyanin